MMSLLRRALGIARPVPEAGGDGIAFRPHVLDRAFTLFGPEDDQSVLGQIRQTGEFEPHVVGLLARVVAGETVALDVGANVGALALVLSALAPRGRVYAFEASPLAYELLQRAIRANGASNIEAIQRAVFSESGATLSFETTSSFLAGSHLGSGAEHEGTVDQVKTVTIDDWVEQQRLARVDLVKMDIEGAELAALAGGVRTLDRWAPDLLIECNAVVMRRFRSGSAGELFDAVSACYPHVYAVPDSFRDGTLVPVASATDLRALLVYGRGNEDLFCTPGAPRACRVLPFAEFVDGIRAAVAGREIVIEPDFEITPRAATLRGRCGARTGIAVTLRNRGPQTLSSAHPHPTHASYHVRSDAGAVVFFDGLRTTLPRAVGAGESAEFEMAVELPALPGLYTAELTLVREGVAWHDQLHVPVAPVRVTVDGP
jgi:FkbM family methyltransferase